MNTPNDTQHTTNGSTKSAMPATKPAPNYGVPSYTKVDTSKSDLKAGSKTPDTTPVVKDAAKSPADANDSATSVPPVAGKNSGDDAMSRQQRVK